MKAKQLWFTAPGAVEVKNVQLAGLAADEVLIRTSYSAISAGSELLAYKGLLPSELPLDASLPAMKNQSSSYPLQYGYACTGRIEQLGRALDCNLLGAKVFAFSPHASHFISKVSELIMLPDDISEEAGIFIANMETAVNLKKDGEIKPIDAVAILGLGVVGQLLAIVIDPVKKKSLCLLDGIESRREMVDVIGSVQLMPPDMTLIRNKLSDGGFDLIFELSGSLEALNMSIELSNFAGRIIVGSWYGEKPGRINLGGKFHRNRLQLISSQVSSINPKFQDVWNKEQRMQEALDAIRHCYPQRLITHRYSLADAAQAYRLLDETPEKAVQVIFEYGK
jgi:2-desacetyl-2-hydroxyethyl bacteriochlorophyllide A dehydrogenase